MIIHDTFCVQDRYIVLFGPYGYEHPSTGSEHAGFSLRAKEKTYFPPYERYPLNTGLFLGTPNDVQFFVITSPYQVDGLVVEGFHYSEECGVVVHVANMTEERIDIKPDDIIGQLEFVLKFEGTCEWKYIFLSTQKLS